MAFNEISLVRDIVDGQVGRAISQFADEVWMWDAWLPLIRDGIPPREYLITAAAVGQTMEGWLEGGGEIFRYGAEWLIKLEPRLDRRSFIASLRALMSYYVNAYSRELEIEGGSVRSLMTWVGLGSLVRDRAIERSKKNFLLRLC